jgi:hypothetical protein
VLRNEVSANHYLVAKGLTRRVELCLLLSQHTAQGRQDPATHACVPLVDSTGSSQDMHTNSDGSVNSSTSAEHARGDDVKDEVDTRGKQTRVMPLTLRVSSLSATRHDWLDQVIAMMASKGFPWRVYPASPSGGWGDAVVCRHVDDINAVLRVSSAVGQHQDSHQSEAHAQQTGGMCAGGDRSAPPSASGLNLSHDAKHTRGTASDGAPAAKSWLVQQHVAPHEHLSEATVHVPVLAVGGLRVYVWDAPVVRLKRPSPFTPMIAAKGAGFDTVTLDRFDQYLGDATATWDKIAAAVERVFESLDGQKGQFLPMRNCFELLCFKFVIGTLPGDDHDEAVSIYVSIHVFVRIYIYIYIYMIYKMCKVLLSHCQAAMVTM